MILQMFTAALIAAASDTTGSAAGAPNPFAMPPHGEAVFRGVDTLSLDWLEREALARNPSFAAMRAAAAEARARARMAGSLMDPMVDIAVAPRSYTEPMSDPMASPGDAEKIPAYKWSIKQRLPVFGERGLERRSARSEAAAALLDAEAARLDLLEQVRLSFFDLYRVERALETNADQVALVNQFRRVALARYASGSEGQLDPLQADTELGMLAHEEAMLKRERRVARVRLNALLNRDPALPLPPPPIRLTVPALADTSRLQLATRAPWPELRASNARVAAEEARLSLAARRRLPQFEIGFERDFFMNEWERRSVAMLGFNLPIGLGRLAAGEDEARAALSRARAERVAVADQVAQRIEEARAEYEEALHEIEVLEGTLLPTSERTLAAARAAYESGRGGFLPLIETARRRAGARLALETARAAAARGWAMLQRSVAGDMTSFTPAAPERADDGRAGDAARRSDGKESQR